MRVFRWGILALGLVVVWSGMQLPSVSASAEQTAAVPVVKGKPLDQVQEVAAGFHFALALKEDGTVWAWGDNERGQLGTGKYGMFHLSNLAVQVPGLANISSIEAGSYGTAGAVKQDGTVWMWGTNANGLIPSGQQNDGQQGVVSTPVQIPGLTGIVDLEIGWDHALALKKDGTVWAWGKNDYGQLGDGTTTDRAVPVQVKNLKDAASISVAGSSSFALTKAGVLMVWGSPSWVYMQNGKNIVSAVPKRVEGLDRIRAFRTNGGSFYAEREDGTFWSWGDNYAGVLGDGTNGYKEKPQEIPALRGTGAFSCGTMQCLAVNAKQQLWVWGNNEWGQIGNGRKLHSYYTPVQLPEWTDAVGLASGYRTTFIIRKDGTLWAAGENRFGETGSGKIGDRYGGDGFGYPALSRNDWYDFWKQPTKVLSFRPVMEAPALHVDGTTLQSSKPAMFIDGAAYVPMRETLEQSGYTVGWDESLKRASALKDGRSIQFSTKDGAVVIDGRQVEWSRPIYDIRSDIMLPAREMANALGWGITWNEEQYRLELSSGSGSQ